MDSTSRRVAALQKEAADLAAEAMTLKKATPAGAPKPPRLKEIAAKLRVIESEYMRLLTENPMVAVTAGNETSVLQSDNEYLRKRNAELERKVQSLQQSNQQHKENQTVLQQRHVQAETGLIAARREIRDKKEAGVDDSFLLDATAQLQHAALQVESTQRATEEKAARIERWLGPAIKDVAASKEQVEVMRREVDLLEALLKKEKTRADKAEKLVEEMRQELTELSDEIVEAKKVVQGAKDTAAPVKKSDDGVDNAMLRKWAEAELLRLKQQLAATGA